MQNYGIEVRVAEYRGQVIKGRLYLYSLESSSLVLGWRGSNIMSRQTYFLINSVFRVAY